jgi:hypothetical protein
MRLAAFVSGITKMKDNSFDVADWINLDQNSVDTVLIETWIFKS